MDRDTMNKLRLDRRLARRRNWIPEQELERELEALPDVSDKIASIASAAEEGGAVAGPAASDSTRR